MRYEHIADIFKAGKKTLSFEFFPPKTEQGRDSLLATAKELMELSPDFFSVTYGAGGSTSKRTLDLVKQLQDDCDIPVMHHFTCTKHTRRDIREQLNEMMANGIHNILALRGDAPAGEIAYEPGPDEPRYAFELVQLIRERADWFSVGVAAFPEGHLETPNTELDSLYTRVKQEVGADFAISQLCFDNEIFRSFFERMHNSGVTMPIVPGILPVINWPKFLNFCDICGMEPPAIIRDVLEPVADDEKESQSRGIDFAINQCKGLLAMNVPGLHLYCLNKAQPAKKIIEELGRDWR